MLVYSGTKSTFQKDAINGIIANKIDSLFAEFGISHESYAEFTSWKNSLPQMALILADPRIDNNVQVAIEYQIPLTSKRVDFMVGGNSGEADNIVVTELKQWESCSATSRENVVIAFTGGAFRDVAHPSQQAYSYAKLIENFNETVREENIHLIPCAFLHNYKEINRKEICNPKYQEAIDDAPIFLQEDGDKLREFLVKHVPHPSSKKLFEIIEHGKLKPSKSLQDSIGQIMNGNSEFEMIDEQQVAYSTILKLVENSIGKEEKHTIIIQGGPGTGKSVIAINLLAKILNNNYSCIYVTKNSAPRTAFSSSLIKGKHSISYLKGLFSGSGCFYDKAKNKYDCILCDEAHRLKAKSGIFSHLGENQVKEIINASKISVFFIDEEQIISTKDIGTIAEIKKWAKQLNSIIHCSDSLKLTSQFRCNGSDGYIAFLDNLLGIRETANKSFDVDYDLKIFDDPNTLREALRVKNINNKARMIAGYCYPWISKHDKTKFDIYLKNGFKAQWNFSTDKFATDEESFEQVGCIHSTQGLEFEYVGIIIGQDLRYENGEIKADPKKRAKTDATIKGLKGNIKLGEKIIKNTYKTLLSRGQKGCYVYCEDEALGQYFKKALEKAKEDKNKITQPIIAS